MYIQTWALHKQNVSETSVFSHALYIETVNKIGQKFKNKLLLSAVELHDNEQTNQMLQYIDPRCTQIYKSCLTN